MDSFPSKTVIGLEAKYLWATSNFSIGFWNVYTFLLNIVRLKSIFM